MRNNIASVGIYIFVCVIYVQVYNLQGEMAGYGRKRQRRPSNRFAQVKLCIHNKSDASNASILVEEHKLIANLYDGYVNVTRQLMQNYIIILNLCEHSTQDLLPAVKYMINAASITEEVDIECVYRCGAESLPSDVTTPPCGHATTST